MTGLSRTVLAAALAAAALPAANTPAQTLQFLPAGRGGEVIVVSVPLSDTFGLAWVGVDEDGTPTLRSASGPAVMAASEIERILGSGEENPLPAVLVVTGGVRPDEISSLVGQLARGRSPVVLPRPSREPLEEGGVERRLAPPGSEATLRLRIPLPPRGDPLRSAAEVLATLLPSIVDKELRAVSVRLGDTDVVVTSPVEAELADVRLDRLRFALARFADDPSLDPGTVERARRRLAVRRLVALQATPNGAELVARWWMAGGNGAVRQLLFGLESVGPHRIEAAARRWLALHPGAAELILPPRVLNPRFAGGPVEAALPSGMTAMLLERPATPLEAVVVLPVLTPDLDGGPTASVLTRLAAAIRQLPGAPGWVEVRRDPARLELAAPAGDVASLVEALGSALETVTLDSNPVTPARDAEARALGLMAGILGLTEGGPLTPARLLRADNLALGALVTDAEAAREALLKLLGGRKGTGDRTMATDLAAASRTRLAVPGTTACIVIRLDGIDGSPAAETALELVRKRTASLEGVDARLTIPRVPGASPALLVVTSESTLPDLETRLEDTWEALTSAPGEEELDGARRGVLDQTARRWSGPVGRAALMASVASGARPWEPPSRWTSRLLVVETEDIARILEGWRDWDALRITGAGPLPVSDLPLPPAGMGP